MGISNTYFQFKQFRIAQEKCAMKVTTDACIQGAWTPVSNNVRRILDIGTGTGLLALMMAQKASDAVIDAIDLDHNAVEQAIENITASAWSNIIHILERDAAIYTSDIKYDLIITNPPFFNNSLLSGKTDKDIARHTLTLSYKTLFHTIEQNLSDNGYASILLPEPESQIWENMIKNNGWFISSKLQVKHRASAPVKRVISIIQRHDTPTQLETLTIKNENNIYSDYFIELLAPYYLNL